jgi:phosphate transport system substrate-binding protein
MKKIFTNMIVLSLMLLFAGCSTDDIGGVLPEFPVIDGSSSTVNMHVAIRVFLTGEENPRVWHSQTYAALERLVPGNENPADVILAVRYYDETLQDVRNRGADLVITPIAKEGFVFITHQDNPVDSLTQEQLRDIYSGKITNWNEVGGKDEEIKAFTRNWDSGSQTALENFMDGIPLLTGLDQGMVIGSMGEILSSIQLTGSGAIGFNIYSWALNYQVENAQLKILAVDGVRASNETLSDKSYPLLVYTYSYYNRDNAKGKALTDWLLTAEGQRVIASAGFVGIFGELPSNR